MKPSYNHPSTLCMSQGHVECEGPNNRIYKFHGNLKVGKDQLVPIEPEQILLRGARLRNTNHVHGTVIAMYSICQQCADCSRAHNNNLKLVSHLLEIVTFYRLSITPPMKLYSKCVPPNQWKWTVTLFAALTVVLIIELMAL